MTPDLVWDETHLKALLGLPRFPLSLIQQEPWFSWIAARGGIEALLDYLLASPLAPHQRQILQLIRQHPTSPAQFYADRLNISISTYFYHLRDLVRVLLQYLNAQEVHVRRQAVAEPTDVPAGHVAPPTNLPALLARLIGADEVAHEAAALLLQQTVRLVNLIGPGGIGKTRLGLEVAKQLLEMQDAQGRPLFPDGVYMVALSAISDAGLVIPQITHTLNIKELSGQPLQETLKTHVHQRRMLLFLDNFEHVLEATPLVFQLLESAPELKILTTSRTTLGVYGEHEFPVPALQLPDLTALPEPQTLSAYPAVELFLERARAAAPNFRLTPANAAAVAEICVQLDGLPLAIELAAARIKLLSPEAMLPRLQQRLDLLTNGPPHRPQRQRTLRDAIDWSYNLLQPAEQALFRGLAIFQGGWTIEAAARVVPGALLGVEEPAGEQRLVESIIFDLLAALVSQNMIWCTIDQDSSSRFGMLETIREYACERLEDKDEAGLLRERHAAYYLTMVERIEPELTGNLQQGWMELLERDHQNLRAALSWMLAQRETDMALRFTSAIWKFWQIHSHLSEGRRFMEATLAQSAGIVSAPHAKTLCGAGWLAIIQGDFEQGIALFDQALALARAMDDPYCIGIALQGAAQKDKANGAYEEAQQKFEESLAIFRGLADQDEAAWSLYNLGRLAIIKGDYVQAEQLSEESMTLFRRQGNRWGMAESIDALARAALLGHKFDRARELFEEALTHFRALGNKWYAARVLHDLGWIALEEARPAEAARLLRQSLSIHRESGTTQGIGLLLIAYAGLAAFNEDWERAAQLLSAGQTRVVRTSAELTAYDTLKCEQLLARLHDVLGAEQYEGARAAGQKLSHEQAFALAQSVWPEEHDPAQPDPAHG